MTLVHPLAVFADVMASSNAFAVNPDYLIGSASNADPYSIATLELNDDDYSIQPFSSLGTVTNTIDLSDIQFYVYYNDASAGVNNVLKYGTTSVVNNRLKYSMVLDNGDQIVQYGFQLKKGSLPNPGGYRFSFDIASDFSFEYDKCNLYFVHQNKNAGNQTDLITVHPESFSGDVYLSGFEMQLNTLYRMNITMYVDSPLGNAVGGDAAFRFEVADLGSDAFVTPGTNSSTQDYESDVSGSLSDISSSIGDMSESLDSAAENLEYISTSQNLIIQGIDNVIMHISDQLYAFWDQLYNLIHEPTYAKLEQILLSLKAIANNSDISAVVDTIEETTQQQITNDNANTAKVESAVEKHGNFIIDGLKGLFIPSDEYFKTYFDDLYEYFSDRFGFLSFPIDLLSRLVDLFVNSSDVDCVLTLPGFEISGEQVWTDQSFNLTEFMETNFSFVLTAIRTVTSVYLIMAFVDLCREKWNEVMSN